jgi:glycosyltransferase involved in cell wall biosynthesis
MYSLIIPVYKNSESLRELLKQLSELNIKFNNNLECVFVIDGSPGNEYKILKNLLPSQKYKSQLLVHSKNFGSLIAVKTGLEYAKGQYYAVLAADLQEPPELIEKIFKELSKNTNDIIISQRVERHDGFINDLLSNIFWKLYQKFINSDIPDGGIDIFGCNKKVRDTVVDLKESHSSLIGLIFWVGYKRKIIKYKRLKRIYGNSARNFKQKYDYMMDSIYSFTDLPIKILTTFGVFGIFLSIIVSTITLISKLSGNTTVPGYTATFLIVTFFSSLNILFLGVIGQYIWRSFENTKQRPNSIVMDKLKFNQ